MKKSCTVLAADLGASSGKVFSLSFDGKRLALEESWRFPNAPLRIQEHLYDDIAYIHAQIKKGFLYARCQAREIRSVSVDTFGNDYGLLNAQNELIGLPYNYRDKRTAQHGQLGDAWDLYKMTGILPKATTTVRQLAADAAILGEKAAEQVSDFLMLPDLLAFFLTGDKSSEYVAASASGLLDIHKKTWSEPILSKLGFPRAAFGPLTAPGTICSELRDAELEALGSDGVRFIKTSGHDSAAAVLAIPFQHEKSLYVSSGSWSLVGKVIEHPVINPSGFACQLNNQGMPDGKVRLQKSLPGLWTLQQCLRIWKERNPDLTFSAVERLAAQETPFRYYIDMEQPQFLQPCNMPAAIQAYCQASGQPVPQSIGEIARCVYESLAFQYKLAAAQLDGCMERAHDTIYVVGGGSRDNLLSAMMADATGKLVCAGLPDASALGNGISQMLALGLLGSMREARQAIRDSFTFLYYEPKQTAVWDGLLARNSGIKERYARSHAYK